MQAGLIRLICLILISFMPFFGMESSAISDPTSELVSLSQCPGVRVQAVSRETLELIISRESSRENAYTSSGMLLTIAPVAIGLPATFMVASALGFSAAILSLPLTGAVFIAGGVYLSFRGSESRQIVECLRRVQTGQIAMNNSMSQPLSSGVSPQIGKNQKPASLGHVAPFVVGQRFE